MIPNLLVPCPRCLVPETQLCQALMCFAAKGSKECCRALCMRLPRQVEGVRLRMAAPPADDAPSVRSDSSVASCS